MKIFKLIKDILAPKKCYSCKKEWHFLCEDCVKKLNNFESICYVCKEKSVNFNIHENCKDKVYFDKVIIFSHYKEKIIEKMIKDFKYYWKKDIWEDFSFYLANLIKNTIPNINNNDFIIIPTPMHFFKKLKRWYNQSEILWKLLAKQLWINFENKLIKKIKPTKQQSILSKEQRKNNLKNVFKINQKIFQKYQTKTIIIIDDVISTWTTLNEISSILKQNWTKYIIWIWIASD